MEPLADPKKDRAIKSVKPPPHKPLSSELLWKDSETHSNLISDSELEKSQRPFKKRRKTFKKRCIKNH